MENLIYAHAHGPGYYTGHGPQAGTIYVNMNMDIDIDMFIDLDLG